MKKILTILMLGLIVLSLTACGNKNEFDIGEISSFETVDDMDVSLSIKEDTLNTTSATIILKNDSDNEIMYSEEYFIEIKQDNEWYEINVIIEFIETASYLQPGESIEITLNWENGYGELATGEYRIVKNIYSNEESFYIAVEFTIE